MKKIDLGKNQIKDINVINRAKLYSLEFLNLEDNKITDIKDAGFDKYHLKTLYLRGNIDLNYRSDPIIIKLKNSGIKCL